MSEVKKKADLAEELRRLNDMLEDGLAGALPELNDILDCSGISAIKTLTRALTEHTEEMRTTRIRNY